MTERRRPHRRGRGQRPYNRNAGEPQGEPNPYRDAGPSEGSVEGDAPNEVATESAAPTPPPPPTASRDAVRDANDGGDAAPPEQSAAPGASASNRRPFQQQPRGGPPREEHPHYSNNNNNGANGSGGERGGRRGRRNRGRGRRGEPQGQQAPTQPPAPVVADAETVGWFEPQREAGFVRRASNSYLTDPADAFVPPQLVRQFNLRRGDAIEATTGRDHRGRASVVDITAINGSPPDDTVRRPEFGALTPAYPERALTLETGRPAKGGPELIRRAIDLMAPIGYGQRALIVAPARAGKTTLMHAITEGIAINHPNASLIILLVDERPEEVTEAISWGVGEVVSSSFDMPAARHTEITEIVMERARRLVETGKDVVIVLDSLTRMARAFNTVERGTGRTLSGGLDATAMAKPKAFFGSARSIAAKDGGGSLTIIATALVETGSRMDEVIFEEFKGTGNCEIKLDRSLADKRIYPAFDIGASATRREEKLYPPHLLDKVYTLRRGLQQMPPQAGMEWMIKRIAATTSNEALLLGL